MYSPDSTTSILQNSGTLTVAQDSNILIPILNLGQLEVSNDCQFGISVYTQHINVSETFVDGGTLAGNSVTISEGTLRGSGIVSLFSYVYYVLLKLHSAFSFIKQIYLHLSPTMGLVQ